MSWGATSNALSSTFWHWASLVLMSDPLLKDHGILWTVAHLQGIGHIESCWSIRHSKGSHKEMTMGKWKKKIFLQRKDFKQPKSKEIKTRPRSRKMARVRGAIGSCLWGQNGSLGTQSLTVKFWVSGRVGIFQTWEIVGETKPLNPVL